MKRIIITAFLLLSIWAQADTPIDERSKTVKCANLTAIVNILTGAPYNEVPVWVGRDGQDTSKYVLFSNGKTGTWTLVQFGTEVGCILGAGGASSVTSFGTRV